MERLVTLITIALGSWGIGESIRLLRMAEAGSILRGQIGPGGFLLGVSVFLFGCGCSKLGRDLARRKDGAEPGKAGGGDRFWQAGLIILISILYALATPYLGYLVSSVAFFGLVYYSNGVRPWPRAVILGTVVAACFYVVFGVLIDVPFPKGIFHIGF